MKADTASSRAGSVCPLSVHSILPLSVSLKCCLWASSSC